MLVYLNVGGWYFVTRRTTMCNTPFFDALTRPSSDDDEGEPHQEVFLDRDPTHFRYVLNWLRGVSLLPSHSQALEELWWEADYYGMIDLRTAIECHHSVAAKTKTKKAKSASVSP